MELRNDLDSTAEQQEPANSEQAMQAAAAAPSADAAVSSSEVKRKRPVGTAPASPPKRPCRTDGIDQPALPEAMDEEGEGEDGLDDEEREQELDEMVRQAAPTGSPNGGRPERVYRRLTSLEHILLRPDTYIGSPQMRHGQLMWVYDEGVGMNRREISFVPGLYKIFDELLVDAANNYATMTRLDVTIDVDTNTITICNNGAGIPVEMHAEEQIYTPELVFGHLYTSSNYTDNDGGRHGLGAKLANIFSTHFRVECLDSHRRKRFRMEWEHSMRTRHEPVVTDVAPNGDHALDYTEIAFRPDLQRFGMTCLDKDTVALLTKRVYDIAGCNQSVTVSLNERPIRLDDFEEYVGLYLDCKKSGRPRVPRVFRQIDERWSVCVALSESVHEFQQVSFVNSVCTSGGGVHVDRVYESLVKQLAPLIDRKNKHRCKVTSGHIAGHVWLFINCRIPAPEFDSQTKEKLMSHRPVAGRALWQLPDDYVRQVATECNIVERVVAMMRRLQDRQLDAIQPGRVMGMLAKLDDALLAGGPHARECTLILTEGDSAKTFAVGGLSVVGRERYGVFPLKGMPRNVRGASHKQLVDNVELREIATILGLSLKAGQQNIDRRALRYGRLMIMADQDQDGSYFKGLIINIVHHIWPGLLSLSGFLTEFVTPRVKATPTSGAPVSFYTMTDYEQWKRANDNGRGWKIKYYKGLGTSSPEEAKDYFGALPRHRITFRWNGNVDGQLLDMVFSRKKASERKEWIGRFEPGICVDHNTKELPICDFVNKELIHFAVADCQRSIPSLVDGLKPGQRKILFTCLDKDVREEIRVAQLSGSVSLHAAYHHGEESLNKTIVGMAHDFVGSNNINLLHPAGNFGSRLQGGRDAASPRYIHTRLSAITRTIFHPDDDKILDYLDDDGIPVEPRYYLPVVPMVLVNGANGMGTGWSTDVPCHNARDVVDNIKRLLRNETPVEMHPWYQGFEGRIALDYDGASPRYKQSGTWDKPHPRLLRITELPIGQGTHNYKKRLALMLEPTTKNVPATIEGYAEFHTDTTVCFVVRLTAEAANWNDHEIEQRFKLAKYIALDKMHLYDENGRIQHYDDSLDILKQFFRFRLGCYQKRKDHLCESLRWELVKMDNQLRFIEEIACAGLIVHDRTEASLLAELADRGYHRLTEQGTGNSGQRKDDDAKRGYGYLLELSMRILTRDKVEELRQRRHQKSDQLVALEATPIETLWERDLDRFLEAYERHTRSSDAEHAEQRAKQQALVREWQQTHFTDCAHDYSETVPLAHDDSETANGRASGSEVAAAHTVAGAAAAGGPFRPTSTPPLPVQSSRRPHQTEPSTDEGRGSQAEAIAPTPTVADQPHWPPAPALDEVYALEVATSEAAALMPGAAREHQ